jgi:hypothetical protein
MQLEGVWVKQTIDSVLTSECVACEPRSLIDVIVISHEDIAIPFMTGGKLVGL